MRSNANTCKLWPKTAQLFLRKRIRGAANDARRDSATLRRYCFRSLRPVHVHSYHLVCPRSFLLKNSLLKRYVRHTRSMEVPTRKSENQSRARPRTVVRKMKSCKVGLSEAPVSTDSTWAHLLSTYSWTQKPKPLHTLPLARPMDTDAIADQTRSTEVSTRKSKHQERARPRTVVRKVKSREVAVTEASDSVDSTWD